MYSSTALAADRLSSLPFLSVTSADQHHLLLQNDTKECHSWCHQLAKEMVTLLEQRYTSTYSTRQPLPRHMRSHNSLADSDLRYLSLRPGAYYLEFPQTPLVATQHTLFKGTGLQKRSVYYLPQSTSPLCLQLQSSKMYLTYCSQMSSQLMFTAPSSPSILRYVSQGLG